MTYLAGSTEALARSYDVALLDLDGVVYVGPVAVPAAPAALAQARQEGMRLAFVTNNAARPAPAVAELLTRLGVPAEAGEVITSAQTAAHYLARRLPAGANVLVVGGAGLVEALTERGLTPVTSADDDPQAVAQGFSPDVDWAQLSEGAIAIRRGAFWLATNLDSTVPSARGPLPGNGSLVAALRHATGVEPMATGKPDPTMHAETVERTGAQRPIVVGDRLDTDIEGAGRVGCASLLVFSGVTTPGDLVQAPPNHRPDYVSDDVSGLLDVHPAVSVADGVAGCGRWSARVHDSRVELSTSASPEPNGSRSDGLQESDLPQATDVPDGVDGPAGSGFGSDALDALRVLCWHAWSLKGSSEVSSEGSSKRPAERQSGGSGDGSSGSRVLFHAADDAARDVLTRLGLAD